MPEDTPPRTPLNRAARRTLFRSWKAKEAAARRYIYEGRKTAQWKDLDASRRAGLKALRTYMLAMGSL